MDILQQQQTEFKKVIETNIVLSSLLDLLNEKDKKIQKKDEYIEKLEEQLAYYEEDYNYYDHI